MRRQGNPLFLFLYYINHWVTPNAKLCKYKDVYSSVIQGKCLAHACKILDLFTKLYSSYRNK